MRAHQREISECTSLDQLVFTFQNIGKSKIALYCHQLLQLAAAEPISQSQIDELRRESQPHQRSKVLK